MVFGSFIEYFQLLSTNLVLTPISVVLLFSTLLIAIVYRKGRNSLPGPVGLPIWGYLPFLGAKPYVSLHELRKKYGNIFGLYMGRNYIVFLADIEAVREVLGRDSTTDRPETTFNFVPDGVGFSSVNGEEWDEQRKYCVRSMRILGLGKSHWETLVEEEVEHFIDRVRKHNGKPFDIGKILTASVANNISSLIFDKRSELDDEAVDFLYRSINAVNTFNAVVGTRNAFPPLYDFLTALGWTKSSQAHKNILELNEFIKRQVKIHKSKNMKDKEENFISGYLKRIEENRKQNLDNSFNESNLYGNIQALFIGASDTTSASLSWLFLAMASHLDVQKKVHEEIGRVIGTDGMVKWSERTALPFTYATIMEGQRWKTIAPLNTPHIATEDLKIGGYDISKGTTLIANNWGIHNDTDYWNDPEEFQPERFLNADGQIISKPDSYVPFSYGKRNCPAEVVAMMEILLYFGSIMQKFLILPPEGTTPNTTDAIVGLTYHPVPQELRFISRR